MTEGAWWTVTETAAFMGYSTTQFNRKREVLEVEGFPTRDPLMKRYASELVRDWYKKRIGKSDTLAESKSQEVNFDAL